MWLSPCQTLTSTTSTRRKKKKKGGRRKDKENGRRKEKRNQLFRLDDASENELNEFMSLSQALCLSTLDI
jgi:hypothetical protein